MFRYANVNPNNANINDCTIRAISVAEGISWDEAYEKLSIVFALSKSWIFNSFVIIVLLYHEKNNTKREVL